MLDKSKYLLQPDSPVSVAPDWLTPAVEAAPVESEAEPEPERFPPLLTPEQSEAKLAANLADADEWIERIGADGRRGFDKPGQPVLTRWWEYTSWDELPTWGEPSKPTTTPKPEPLARKRSTRKRGSA